MRILGRLTAVFLLACAAQAHPLYLVGKVGPSPVLVKLERNAGHITGWYFYLRIGKEIRLDGKISAKGDFQIDEFDTAKKTGTFLGAAIGTHWAGSWRNDAGPLTFSLNESRAAPPDGRFRCEAKTIDRKFGYTTVHSVDLVLAKDIVKKLELSRTETSRYGDNQSCTIGLEDLKPTASDAGILLRTQGDAPHCNIRILDAGDYVYVQMGEPGEDGNDCRAAADEMFCSPRSFWTDVILDRKSGSCRSVE